MVWLRVPYRLLYYRPQSHCSRQNQNAQSNRQKDFPSYLHELVKTVTRERATIPDIEVHKPGNFDREPINILDADANGGDEQDQSNQAEHCAESCEADGLNPEQGMFRHTCGAVETHRRQKE